MTLLTKGSVSLILLLLSLVVLWIFSPTSSEHLVDEVKPKKHALTLAINTCDGITERAASHLVAVVEFQKLEIAGRKARVFKMCMNDRGYIENTQWLKHSTSMAKKIAKDTHISVDEALENLRRTHMKESVANKAFPSYWAVR